MCSKILLLSVFICVLQICYASVSEVVLPSLKGVRINIRILWPSRRPLDSAVELPGERVGAACEPVRNRVHVREISSTAQSNVISLHRLDQVGAPHFYVHLFAHWRSRPRLPEGTRNPRAQVLVEFTDANGVPLSRQVNFFNIAPDFGYLCPRSRVLTLSVNARAGPSDAARIIMSNYRNGRCKAARKLPTTFAVPGVYSRVLTFDPPSLVQHARTRMMAIYSGDNLFDAAVLNGIDGFHIYDEKDGQKVPQTTLKRVTPGKNLYIGEIFPRTASSAPATQRYKAVPFRGSEILFDSPAVQFGAVMTFPRLWGVGLGAERAGMGSLLVDDGRPTSFLHARINYGNAETGFGVKTTFGDTSATTNCPRNASSSKYIQYAYENANGQRAVVVSVDVKKAFEDGALGMDALVEFSVAWTGTAPSNPAATVEVMVYGNTNPFAPSGTDIVSWVHVFQVTPKTGGSCEAAVAAAVCLSDIQGDGLWQAHLLIKQSSGQLM